jgi:site-specific DNA-methyltransferase (adenine-specific)
LAGNYAPQSEWIIYAVKGSPTLRGRPPDVLRGDQFLGTDHPTEKPLDLLKLFIETHTDPGHVVVDPFLGSGGTVIQAAKLGRDFFGCELDEAYHRSVVERIHAIAAEGSRNQAADAA